MEAVGQFEVGRWEGCDSGFLCPKRLGKLRKFVGWSYDEKHLRRLGQFEVGRGEGYDSGFMCAKRFGNLRMFARWVQRANNILR